MVDAEMMMVAKLQVRAKAIEYTCHGIGCLYGARLAIQSRSKTYLAVQSLESIIKCLSIRQIRGHGEKFKVYRIF
jgi:hypothetical protein